MGAAPRTSRPCLPLHGSSPLQSGKSGRGQAGCRLDGVYREGILRGGVLVAILLAGGGCRTGGGSSLSWWPGSAENSQLAKSDGEADAVAKPSETQPPYPTTSTPEGYGVGPVVPASAESVAGGSATGVSGADGAGRGEAAAVTYGKEPPAQVGLYQAYPATGAPPAVLTPPEVIQPEPGVPAAAPSTTAPGGMTGGGSAWSGGAAGAQPTTPASGLPTAAAGTGGAGWQPNGQGGAAASGTGSVSIAPAGSVPSAPPDASFGTGSADGIAGDRYAVAAGSRFSGGSGSPVSAAQSAALSGPSMQPAVPPQPMSGFGPAAFEGGGPSPVPSTGAGPATQSGAEGSTQPQPVPGQPGRRPDPGYRPGGTSTYRPAQAILESNGLESNGFESNGQKGGLAWGSPSSGDSALDPSGQRVVPAGYQGVPATGQDAITSP
jgi:hypothetical protein